MALFEDISKFQYFPLELEPIFKQTLKQLHKIINKNVKIILSLEWKKLTGEYKPVLT